MLTLSTGVFIDRVFQKMAHLPTGVVLPKWICERKTHPRPGKIISSVPFSKASLSIQPMFLSAVLLKINVLL
jgi:hypothetical protein